MDSQPVFDWFVCGPQLKGDSILDLLSILPPLPGEYVPSTPPRGDGPPVAVNGRGPGELDAYRTYEPASFSLSEAEFMDNNFSLSLRRKVSCPFSSSWKFRQDERTAFLSARPRRARMMSVL